MDGEMTTNAQTEGVAGAVSGSAAEVQEPAGAAEGASQANESAFQKFLEGLFGGKDKEKTEGGHEPGKGGEGAKESEKPTGKTYNQEEFDNALEAAKKEWEAQAAEDRRVAALSPEEKAAEERKQKDAQIADLQAQILRGQLRAAATAELEKNDYPAGLAELLDYSSKEAMEKSLASTMEIFKGSLGAALKTKLRGKVPEGLGAAAATENMMKDQIARNIRGL